RSFNGFHVLLTLLRFDIGPDYIVGFAGRHPLGELAPVIRNQAPFRFLLVGTADLDRDTVRSTALCVPNGTEDQGIRGRLLLRLVFSGGNDAERRRHQPECNQEIKESRTNRMRTHDWLRAVTW